MTGTAAGLAAGELRGVADNVRLAELADAPVFTVFQRLETSPRGLTEPEAADRLRRFGDNESFHATDDGVARRIVAAARSPFVALLAGLGLVFVVVGDARDPQIHGEVEHEAIICTEVLEHIEDDLQVIGHFRPGKLPD